MRTFAGIQRAYSVVEFQKDVDDSAREIRGTATTPQPDRYGDIVVSKGAQFVLPIPLLWQHNASQPVGHVIDVKVFNRGIDVIAKFVKIDEPGILKDRLDEAWQSVKHGLVRGLSIGFRAMGRESIEVMEDGGLKFLEWEWLELSAVTIPANSGASIDVVKQFDRQIRAAAFGQQKKPRPPVLLIDTSKRGDSRETVKRGGVKLITNLK